MNIDDLNAEIARKGLTKPRLARWVYQKNAYIAG